MIGGGPIGAGGAVRPFYNRGAAAPAPPAIARVVIGSDDSLPDTTSIFVGADIPAGALVLCAICYDNRFLVGAVSPAFVTDGRSPAMTNSFGFGVDSVVNTYALALGGTGISAGDALNWTWPISQPSAVGALAIYVTGLAVPALDKTASASGAGKDQDSGLTAATAVANEFVWGIIGTNGRQADVVGAWQAGLAAGIHEGYPVVPADCKEGFAIVAAIGQQRARVTGATNRDWAAICETWRG